MQNHETGVSGSKGMMWMMIPCLLILGILGLHLLGINFLVGNSLSVSGYIWPILIVISIGVILWHASIIRFFRTYSAPAQRHYSENEIVSRNGLHWHPEIAIYLKGVKQEVPHMGISDMDMSAMHKIHSKMQKQHMHEGPNDQGIIHLKFEGVVLKSDIMLGQVFKKLGKNTRSYGANLKMIVNGKENTEYENYVMQDKDTIELRYE